MPHLHTVSARVSPASETPYIGFVGFGHFCPISFPAQQRRNAQWYPMYSGGEVRAARPKVKE
jgi:hypothetical protein